VCGSISHDDDGNGLEMFEFEGRAVEDGTFKAFTKAAKREGLGELIEEIRQGYEERSPSGGLHWFYSCPATKSEKLAVNEQGETLAETKGQGGFAILAPTPASVSPDKKPWVLLHGGLDTVVVITADERDALHALVRQFNRGPSKEFLPPKKWTGKGRPGDVFNEQAEWAEVLEPHGWEYFYTARNGREHWSRPGKEAKSTSATVSPDGQLLHVFSTSTPFEANRSYNKFYIYAVLNYPRPDGQPDWETAACELAKLGYGSPRTAPHSEVVTIRMSDVEPEHVDWLWGGRLARGKMTLVAGDPSQGKSTFTDDLAARLSSGKKLPMSTTRHDPMSVVLMTAEDGLADTVAPRLLAAGADMSRIEAIIGHRHEDGFETPISLPEDIPALREIIERLKAQILIIDPLNAFLTGQVDSHRDHHIRRAMHPLAKLGEETDVAILLICHLTKNAAASPIYRVGGSIGLPATARLALLVAKDPNDEDRRILAGLKSNLSPLPKSLVFKTVEDSETGASLIKWKGFSDLTSTDLLATSKKERDHGALDAARSLLGSILRDRDVPVDEIEAEAANYQISKTTLQRAKQEMGVVSKRRGYGKNGEWVWSLGNG
jgi:archaellum biogenesis ATPase FlaH